MWKLARKEEEERIKSEKNRGLKEGKPERGRKEEGEWKEEGREEGRRGGARREREGDEEGREREWWGRIRGGIGKKTRTIWLQLDVSVLQPRCMVSPATTYHLVPVSSHKEWQHPVVFWSSWGLSDPQLIRRHPTPGTGRLGWYTLASKRSTIQTRRLLSF